MALDSNSVGTAIKDIWFGSVGAGAPVTAAQIEAKWQATVAAIYADIKANMELDLAANDIPVNPGTFTDSLSAPVTGQGQNAAAVVTGNKFK